MGDKVTTNVSSKENCPSSSAEIQELCDNKELLKQQHKKYAKYKILYDAIQDCLCDSDLFEPTLKAKVKDILMGCSCAEVVNLNDGTSSEPSSALLGLTDLDGSNQMNYNELMTVKDAVEVTLQNKYKNICDEFQQITGKNINTVLSEVEEKDEDQELLLLKEKLKEEQRQYLQNLLEEKEIFDGMVKLRLEKLPEACKEKVKEVEIKSRISELQSRIVHERARVDIFLETSNSQVAYEEFFKDIKAQQQECDQEIKYLQKLKEQYKQVACREYDEILKSFIQYKSSFTKKKMLYDSLQTKRI